MPELTSKIGQKSFKPAVKTIGGGDVWNYNGLRFPTKEEALQSARDLMNRWMLVTECDAHESDDQPNYTIVDNVMLAMVGETTYPLQPAVNHN